jgi:hypothetical protein
MNSMSMSSNDKKTCDAVTSSDGTKKLTIFPLEKHILPQLLYLVSITKLNARLTFPIFFEKTYIFDDFE